MISIDVLDPFRQLVADGILREAAEEALKAGLKGEMPSLAIRITDEEEIRSLNRQYRGLDKTTDVLSFSADFFDPDLETRYLGDVVICYPVAAAQADARGHDAAAELQLLVVHGVLHLLGHDHGSTKEKDAMWAVQDQALRSLGLDMIIGEELP